MRLPVLLMLSLIPGAAFADPVPPETLDRLRLEIDRIDRDIVERIACRFLIVDRISDVKAGGDLPVRDEAREAALLQTRSTWARDLGLDAAGIQAIFEAVLVASRDRQSTRRRGNVSAPASPGVSDCPAGQPKGRESPSSDSTLPPAG